MTAHEHDRVGLVWPGKTTGVERISLPFQTTERVNEALRLMGPFLALCHRLPCSSQRLAVLTGAQWARQDCE